MHIWLWFCGHSRCQTFTSRYVQVRVKSQVNTHKYAAIISYAGQLAIEPTSDEEIQTKRDEHHTSKELDRQVDDNR